MRFRNFLYNLFTSRPGAAFMLACSWGFTALLALVLVRMVEANESMFLLVPFAMILMLTALESFIITFSLGVGKFVMTGEPHRM